jgi:hypothetical protein
VTTTAPAEDIFSLYLLFYSFDINFSANLLHRAMKIYEASQNHSYSHRYSSEYTPTDIIDSNHIAEMARKFEKNVPLQHMTFIFKTPIVKIYPFTHFPLIASSLPHHNNILPEFYLKATVQTVQFNLIQPLDDIITNELYQVVRSSTNPVAKRLINDAYVHGNLIVTNLNLILKINKVDSSFIDYLIIEPCYIELNTSSMIIMKPEMWNSMQYFPLKEYRLELPNLKLNLHKQTVFILNDYLEFYAFQNKMLNLNKIQIKKIRLRHMVYRRLMNDFSPSTSSSPKRQQIGQLKLIINDTKLKYSVTKIMQIFELNCNTISSYMLNYSNNELTSLFETKTTTSSNNKIKDLIIVRIQLPLIVDPNNSFIADPLIFYLNLNEIQVNITDDFIKWLNYKPIRSDDEILNLLILELFDDSNVVDLSDLRSKSTPTAATAAAAKSEEKTFNKRRAGESSLNSFNTTINSRITKKSTTISQGSSYSIASQSELSKSEPLKDTNEIKKQKLPTTTRTTLVDTYYDLVKSLHIQIIIKSISIQLKSSFIKNSNPNDSITINLPSCDVKSIGTKCDLEDLLIISKVIELPCSCIPSSEKTSDKLPWLIDFKGLELFFLNENKLKHSIVSSFDLKAVFSLRPKYHQYNNLLSSLTVVFNLNIPQSLTVKLVDNQLLMITQWTDVIKLLIMNVSFFIDYAAYEAKEDVEQIDEYDNTNNNNDDLLNDEMSDETKSYSTVSILKEYDLESVKLMNNTNHNLIPGDSFSTSRSSLSSSSSTSSSSISFTSELERSNLVKYEIKKKHSDGQNKKVFFLIVNESYFY